MGADGLGLLKHRNTETPSGVCVGHGWFPGWTLMAGLIQEAQSCDEEECFDVLCGGPVGVAGI